MSTQWRGVNHNIYSQSTWTSGDPNPGDNYVASDHRTIDYFHAKGVNHLRMMFTWEWLQPDRHGPIPGTGASSTYWNAFRETVAYATGLGIAVTIAHYGWAGNFWPNGNGNTTPSWQGVGNRSGHEYTTRPRGIPVHVGEIGFSEQSEGAPETWASFVQYCDENSDVVVGFDWWGASEPKWWTDTGPARFSVSPTSPDTYTGDTENMTMIQDAFTG